MYTPSAVQLHNARAMREGLGVAFVSLLILFLVSVFLELLLPGYEQVYFKVQVSIRIRDCGSNLYVGMRVVEMF